MESSSADMMNDSEMLFTSNKKDFVVCNRSITIKAWLKYPERLHIWWWCSLLREIITELMSCGGSGKETVDEHRFKDEECSKCMIRKWEETAMIWETIQCFKINKTLRYLCQRFKN